MERIEFRYAVTSSKEASANTPMIVRAKNTLEELPRYSTFRYRTLEEYITHQPCSTAMKDEEERIPGGLTGTGHIFVSNYK